MRRCVWHIYVYRYAAKRTVIDVKAAIEHDFRRIDVKRITLKHTVVNHCAQQVVCRRNGVEIPRKMQVDVLHWQNLAVSATRRATLYAKHRSERRFAQGKAGFCADKIHSVGKSYADRRFSLAGSRRVDCRNKYQFCAAFRLRLSCNLGFVLAVQFQFILSDAYFGGNFRNGFKFTIACNFYISHRAPLVVNHFFCPFVTRGKTTIVCLFRLFAVPLRVYKLKRSQRMARP